LPDVPGAAGISIERNGSSPAGGRFPNLASMKYLHGLDLTSYLALLAFAGYLALAILA
jgi:hypothetical protein